MAKLSKQARAILKATTVGAPNTFDLTVRNRKIKDGSGVYNDKIRRASIVRGFTQSNLKNASSEVKIGAGGILVADPRKR